jgi:hypothetical protein
MRPGDGVAGIVTSPPYADSVNSERNGIDWRKMEHGQRDRTKEPNYATYNGSGITAQRYGETAGQLGTAQGDTFWAAALQIVQQCFVLLKPGGVAIWIVKSYVRDKQLVDFPGEWKTLCEHVGFQTLHVHQALLVDSYGTQGGLFGPETEVTRARKSFFRRLAERNGAPPIDCETVLCMRKRAHALEGDDAAPPAV